ncbi:MAG: hypothetical protein EA398_00720 [Deltaproteobacteria bacterium]|nr:MAG: hypothetical protein EA398_00720 [Deltaproteobacteria bacterium]
MYQPNFLEVETRLRRAVVFCSTHHELRSSADYRDRLAAVLDHFERTTRATDALHTSWRLKLGEQLLAYKRARLAWDTAVALCDEHGVEGVPRDKIVYTEGDQLVALIEKTIAFLEERRTEWPWVEEKIRVLRSGITESRAVERDADTIFANYRVEVKRRVAAWEDAVALLKEYLRDSRLEASSLAGYRGLELRID